MCISAALSHDRGFKKQEIIKYYSLGRRRCGIVIISVGPGRCRTNLTLKSYNDIMKKGTGNNNNNKRRIIVGAEEKKTETNTKTYLPTYHLALFAPSRRVSNYAYFVRLRRLYSTARLMRRATVMTAYNNNNNNNNASKQQLYIHAHGIRII